MVEWYTRPDINPGDEVLTVDGERGEVVGTNTEYMHYDYSRDEPTDPVEFVRVELESGEKTQIRVHTLVRHECGLLTPVRSDMFYCAECSEAYYLPVPDDVQ